MRRLMLLALVVASVVIAGAVVLGSANAAKPLRSVPRSLRQQLRALERGLALPGRARKPVHPRALNVVPSVPPGSGYACPVSATSPCSSVPCVLYVAPPAIRTPVAPGRREPCARNNMREIPAMAR